MSKLEKIIKSIINYVGGFYTQDKISRKKK